MLTDAKRYLLSLISEGEHQQQDFKYKVADALKLAKSVSAFANTDGGRLLIGVRDDGHLSGVRSEEEIFMMQAAATNYCRPAVQVAFETFTVEKRQILIASVERSTQRPIRALCDDGRWRAYIRVADENIVASPVHLRIWRAEQSTEGQFVSIGEEEERVMQVLSHEEPLTLQQVVRRSGVRRQHVIVILARLVSFSLASCQLRGDRFVFT